MERASFSYQTPDIRIERGVYDESVLGTVHGGSTESLVNIRQETLFTRCLRKPKKADSCSWFMDWIHRFLLKRAPILHWLPKYSVKENLLTDINGGVTLAVMHVPQGKTYGSNVDTAQYETVVVKGRIAVVSKHRYQAESMYYIHNMILSGAVYIL